MRGHTTTPVLPGRALDKLPSNPLSDQVGTSSNRNTITCTTGAAHTWGSYVEIDPSLSADCDGIVINMRSLHSAAATDSSTLLRIGTGPATETTWAIIGVGYNSYSSGAGAACCEYLIIPGRIPSGTRVAVSAQSARATLTVAAVFTFLASDKTIDYVNPPVSIGYDTATSRGITLTAPGSLNTKGAWTVISASTSAAFTALALGFQGAAGTNMNKTGLLVDIGVGPADQEVVIIPDIYLMANANEEITAFSPVSYGVNIPAGSRLVARYARANAGNALDLCVVAS